MYVEQGDCERESDCRVEPEIVNGRRVCRATSSEKDGGREERNRKKPGDDSQRQETVVQKVEYYTAAMQ